MQDGSVSPAKAFFRNKWVRLILVIDFLAIIGIIAITIYNSTKNSIINFAIAPIDATITVNGDSSYSNGSFQFRPGTYEIAISHDNLNSKTFTIDLQPNTNTAITTFLSQDGNFDFYELRDNYSSYLMLERIAASSDNQTTDHDTSAESFIANFQKNYNLYQTELPIEYRESTGYGQDLSILKNITIRAKYDCEFTLCIQALIAGTDNKDFINSLLEEKGFNVEDFEIEYEIF